MFSLSSDRIIQFACAVTLTFSGASYAMIDCFLVFFSRGVNGLGVSGQPGSFSTTKLVGETIGDIVVPELRFASPAATEVTLTSGNDAPTSLPLFTVKEMS